MASMIGALSSFGKDSAVLKKTVKRGTAKRMVAFAAAYKWLLLLFLLVVIANASIGIANPLIYRYIINDGILKGNIPLIVRLAALIAVLGFIDAALGMTQGWLSARIDRKSVG
jgi:ATP-binding cassette subfamily B protein